MQVLWRPFRSENSPVAMEVDETYATRITPDGGDLSTSVAKLIVDLEHKAQGWSGDDGGDGPIVEVLSPDAMKGVFFVAMSRNNRRGILGTMGYRVYQSSAGNPVLQGREESGCASRSTDGHIGNIY